jgi:transposase
MLILGKITMYLSEGVNQKYCYACEKVWDKTLRKYRTPAKCIGRLDEDKSLIPNRYLLHLFSLESTSPASLGEYERLLIRTIIEKYGENVKNKTIKSSSKTPSEDDIQTAKVVFIGPDLIFGKITKRYRLDSLLRKAFDEKIANDILALAWYVTSEGSALSDSDSWLNYYENPHGSGMSSQDVSRLLDTIDCDGMMTFYKFWHKVATSDITKTDKVLYDLTSISYYGTGIAAAEPGYNRDHEKLPQVNFALLCLRTTAMPLFAWSMNGSISDVSTLGTTLQFLKKFQYKPDCLMMDRGFCSMENLTGMFKNGYTFLQAVKLNAQWIYGVIDVSERTRFTPDSKIDIGERTYYASTSICRWVRIEKTSSKDTGKEDVVVHVCNSDSAREKYVSDKEGIEVIAQYPCRVHVLFCQDLVGRQHDRFMDKLKAEYDRLVADETTSVQKEFEKCIKTYRKKYARNRTVEYDADMIAQHKNKYAGYICFLTNDRTIKTAREALTEYSTRDYIEKDFDEMKNNLDMKRIRVQTDARMKSRLFIQFIAEIFMREIRVCMRSSETCKKLTRKQIFSHIKTICKVKFKGRYKDVYPELSRQQRDILKVLNVSLHN